jgi:hypothetical protein
MDHISRTLNLFELHQYLISLLRKTQNTFLELALTNFGWWEFFPKRKLITKTWITSVGPWICLNCISTLFPYWEKRKIHFWSRRSQFLADGNFSQKGNYQPNHRSHQQDPEYIWITSVPYFLIEKNAKYIFGAGAHNFWLMGIFPKKEIINQMIENYF